MIIRKNTLVTNVCTMYCSEAFICCVFILYTILKGVLHDKYNLIMKHLSNERTLGDTYVENYK